MEVRGHLVAAGSLLPPWQTREPSWSSRSAASAFIWRAIARKLPSGQPEIWHFQILIEKVDHTLTHLHTHTHTTLRHTPKHAHMPVHTQTFVPSSMCMCTHVHSLFKRIHIFSLTFLKDPHLSILNLSWLSWGESGRAHSILYLSARALPACHKTVSWKLYSPANRMSS